MIIKVLFLITFHFIGDFLLQNSRIAKKNSKLKYLILHCAIYGLILAIPIFLLFDYIWGILVLLIIAVSHYGIDILRIKLDKKYDSVKFSYYSFIVDQLTHIALLILIAVFANNYDITSKAINDFLLHLDISTNFEQLIKILFSMIFVISPSSFFIKHTLNYLFFSKEEN